MSDQEEDTRMKRYLLRQCKNRYKANLHCHTVLSDGHLSPEEIKQAYQERGYQIVAFTDHRTYAWHRELNDNSFLALAALEVDINDIFSVPGDFSRVKTWHFNLYDKEPWTRPFAGDRTGEAGWTDPWYEGLLPAMDYHNTEELNRYIEQMNRNGFLVCYNHPYWSLQDCVDYTSLVGIWGMEIYNYGCEHDGLYGYHPQAYDEMLRSGILCKCVAADDNHNSYPFGHPLCDSFGGYLMIHADELEYSCIIRALTEGNYCSVMGHPAGSSFGSSAGPDILEAYIEDHRLYITASPVKKIYVMTRGRNCYKAVAEEGTMLTHAVFTLDEKDEYIRISVMDVRGLRADSNVCCVKEEKYLAEGE